MSEREGKEENRKREIGVTKNRVRERKREKQHQEERSRQKKREKGEGERCHAVLERDMKKSQKN